MSHQTDLGRTEQRALSDVLLCHIDQGRRNSIVQAYSWPPPMQCCIQPALPLCKQLEDDQPPFRVEKVWKSIRQHSERPVPQILCLHFPLQWQCPFDNISRHPRSVHVLNQNGLGQRTPSLLIPYHQPPLQCLDLLYNDQKPLPGVQVENNCNQLWGVQVLPTVSCFHSDYTLNR